MATLRVPKWFIGLGLVCIVAWTVANLIAVLPTFDSASVAVYWLTTTVGYGLAGFACWRWIVSSQRTRGSRSRVLGPSRWMAAASLMTAAGVATLTYQLYQNHGSFALDSFDVHYGVRLLGDAVGTLGFLLAAVGFWLASSALPDEPEGELVQASPIEGGTYSDAVNDVRV